MRDELPQLVMQEPQRIHAPQTLTAMVRSESNRTTTVPVESKGQDDEQADEPAPSDDETSGSDDNTEHITNENDLAVEADVQLDMPAPRLIPARELAIDQDVTGSGIHEARCFCDTSMRWC